MLVFKFGSRLRKNAKCSGTGVCRRFVVRTSLFLASIATARMPDCVRRIIAGSPETKRPLTLETERNEKIFPSELAQ